MSIVSTQISEVTVSSEVTPNPAALKFVFSKVIATDTFDFPNVESTEKSPLAAKIFGFPWVSQVFIGENFVTITKQDWVDWKVLANPLAGLLAEHVNSGVPVIIEIEKSFASDLDDTANDSDMVKQIKQILSREIKPVVQLDGGDIAFVKYENQLLYLQLKGACASCPSSQATVKDGIEVRMKQTFPEILEVIAV